MSQIEKKVTMERISFEFCHIFKILDDAHDLIWEEDTDALMNSVIAPLQMILRDLSDTTDRIAANGFAIKEGNINRKFGNDRVSNILVNLRLVLEKNVIANWVISPARLFDWQCFGQVSRIFEEANNRLDVLVHVIRNDFEPPAF